jgi:maltose O-acetyltransferase
MIDELLAFVPGRLGRKLRARYYKNKCAFFGKNVYLGMGTIIDFPENVKIGDNASINRYCVIGGYSGKIIIGDDVMIGCNCVFRCSNHKYSRTDILMNMQGYDCGEIHIDNDVWIGAKVVILKDVTIGAHSIIGAGSVVTKDIPAYSIAVGNPARVIKKRC